MIKQFPEKFIFGAASASYQVEGAFDADGKGLSNWDVFSKIEGKTFEGTNGDVAVDHYHRYKEDVQLMKKMGLQSYRFSISWSRILPKGIGEVNENGIKFYNDLIDELLLNDIEPIITLYHWDLPNCLEELGGWSNTDSVDWFLEYANLCISEFADKVNKIITFNEMSVFVTHGYIKAAHPPNLSDETLFAKALHNVNMAHAKCVIETKKKFPTLKIGITHAIGPSYPMSTSKEDFLQKKLLDEYNYKLYFDASLKGKYTKTEIYTSLLNSYGTTKMYDDCKVMREAAALNDFVGINYYQPSRISATSTPDCKVRKNQTREKATGAAEKRCDYLNYSKWGWEIYPDALYDILRDIYMDYNGIEIIITENGLGDEDPVDNGVIDDVNRIHYINDHLFQVKKAITNGINVSGYYAWSFTDLLSWLNGYKKQYGFVYVDHNNNLERICKSSFHWYSEVIKSMGENIQLPDTYK